MDFKEVVAKRRTVREFEARPVPPDAVRRALEAGLRAPCNAHLKSWQFILLRDRAKKIQTVTEGLKARDMKDRAEIETFVSRFADEELRKVYRRSLPLQLTMMLEAPEVLVVCYKMKPLAECRSSLRAESPGLGLDVRREHHAGPGRRGALRLHVYPL